MAGLDFLSGDSWIPAAVSLAGGLLGSQSTNSSQSATRSMDPRLDRYVYGSDGQSGLLSDAFGLYSKQAAQGGLNDLQRQGMGMQQQYLMSPQYQQGYANMASLGNALMGGGVAANPFTQPGATTAVRGNQQQLPAFNYDFSKITGGGTAQIPNYASTPSLMNPASQALPNGGSYKAGTSQAGQGGGVGQPGSGSTIGTGQMTDAINAQAKNDLTRYLALGIAPAAAIALVRASLATSGVLNAVNEAADPLGALNAVQGWTDTDPGYNAWGGGYSDGGGGWGNGGYGFGTGTGGMGD